MVIETKAEVDLNAQPKQPTAAEMAEKKERDKMHIRQSSNIHSYCSSMTPA